MGGHVTLFGHSQVSDFIQVVHYSKTEPVAGSVVKLVLAIDLFDSDTQESPLAWRLQEGCIGSQRSQPH